MSALISTLGLIVVVIAYCCLGGATFKWLEADKEREAILRDRLRVTALVKQHAAKLFSQIHIDYTNKTVEFLTNTELTLKNVSRDAFYIAERYSWDGRATGSTVTLDWTLPGAILFSVTTITTIGKLSSAP